MIMMTARRRRICWIAENAREWEGEKAGLQIVPGDRTGHRVPPTDPNSPMAA
jgi:hypothetical protein